MATNQGAEMTLDEMLQMLASTEGLGETAELLDEGTHPFDQRAEDAEADAYMEAQQDI